MIEMRTACFSRKEQWKKKKGWSLVTKTVRQCSLGEEPKNMARGIVRPQFPAGKLKIKVTCVISF